MTTRPATFDRSVIRSSVMPSAKYALSASPLMLSNGSTAIDGLAEGAAPRGGGRRRAAGGDGRSGDGAPGIATRATAATAASDERRDVDAQARRGRDGTDGDARVGDVRLRLPGRTANARIGSEMFLTVCVTAIVEGRRDAALDGAAHGLGHDDAARCRERLQAGGDVDAVAVDVAVRPSRSHRPDARRCEIADAGRSTTSPRNDARARCTPSAAVTAPVAVSNTASTESPGHVDHVALVGLDFRALNTLARGVERGERARARPLPSAASSRRRRRRESPQVAVGCLARSRANAPSENGAGKWYDHPMCADDWRSVSAPRPGRFRENRRPYRRGETRSSTGGC